MPFTTNPYVTSISVDEWLNVAGLKAPGSKPATEILHGVDTAWQFANAIEANQESVTGRVKIPVNAKKNTTFVGLIGWSADGVSPGDCKWQVDYRWTSPGDATDAGAQESLTVVAVASATSNGLITTEVLGIDTPPATASYVSFKITRLSGDVADTISDTIELMGVALKG